ncbi:hypothetical protein EMIT0P43_30011 [Pseudomonas jessenii]
MDDGCDSLNINLQVDASSKRLGQRRSQPLTRVRINLLKHYLSTIQIKVCKSIFRALISYFELQAINPKSQAAIQVAYH